MTDRVPKNFLSAERLGLLTLTSLSQISAEAVERFQSLGIASHMIRPTKKGPWEDPDLWTLLESTEWRQLLIISAEINSFETGLAMMALQKGFNVYVCVPNPAEVSESRITRLRQMSAIVLSIEEALADLRISHPTK